MPDGQRAGQQDDILREQVRLAFRHLPTMQATSVVVAVILSYAVRHLVSEARIAAWLLTILVVAAARVIAYYRFSRQSKEPFAGRAWANVYLSMALASGILWGLSAFIIFPAGRFDLISMFVLVIASLSAATTVSHSSIKFAPAAWAGPALLFYGARCVAEGGQAQSTIAVLILVYLFTIVRYSLTYHATVTEAIAIKFENLRLVADLQEALAQVKTLRGFIPICAWCKKIRDDQGYWHAVEIYVREHSEAEFSHGVCPSCLARLSSGEDVAASPS